MLREREGKREALGESSFATQGPAREASLIREGAPPGQQQRWWKGMNTFRLPHVASLTVKPGSGWSREEGGKEACL